MINVKSLKIFSIIIVVLSGIYFGKVNRSIAAQVLKIGYVDVQKVITDCEAGKKAIEYLKREYESKGEVIKKRKAKLKELSDELSKLASVMDEEVIRRKEKEYQRAQRDLKIFMEDSNQEVVDKEKEIVAKIASEITRLVEDIGKDEEYTMIFDSNRITGIILYATDKIDLTEDVIKRYNYIYSKK